MYKLDQMRSFFEDFMETYESFRIEADEFIDAGEHVVVPQTAHARGQRDESVDVIDIDERRLIAVVKGFAMAPHFEAEVEMNWAWLITVKDGLATRVETFTDKAQARSRRA